MKNELPEAEMRAIWERIVTKYIKEGYEALSRREKVWWDIETFFSMSDSGGFAYYFDVSAGDDIQWLLDSLEVVSAPRTREAVMSLLKVFPNGWPSSDEFERKTQVNDLIEKYGFDELEASFNWPENLFTATGESIEPWEALVWKYWQEHADE